MKKINLHFYEGENLLFEIEAFHNKHHSEDFENEKYFSFCENTNTLKIFLSKGIRISGSLFPTLFSSDRTPLISIENKTFFLVLQNFEERLALCYEFYEKTKKYVSFFPGIAEMLTILKESGYSLFLDSGTIKINSPIPTKLIEDGFFEYTVVNSKNETIFTTRQCVGDGALEVCKRKFFLKSGKYINDEKNLLRREYKMKYLDFVRKIIFLKL